MPDLNKQTLINLLIDSPLREPIKINLIDIINNTKDADLPKTFSTIQKELEIYTKATNRRLKLADEITSKLSGKSDPASDDTTMNSDSTPKMPSALDMDSEDKGTDVSTDKGPVLPPPAANMNNMPSTPSNDSMSKNDEPVSSNPDESLEMKLDDIAPTMPTPPTSPTPPATPTPPQPTVTEASSAPANTDLSDDEEALAEIQKELNALKNSASMESTPTPPSPEPKPSQPGSSDENMTPTSPSSSSPTIEPQPTPPTQ